MKYALLSMNMVILTVIIIFIGKIYPFIFCTQRANFYSKNIS